MNKKRKRRQKPKLEVGCVSLVEAYDDKFVAIDSPQRGIILPGGKWNGRRETYREAAVRELREETGLIATEAKYLFGCVGTKRDVYVLTFKVKVKTVVEGFESHEGKTVFATWDDLLSGAYGAYYDILREVYEERNPVHTYIDIGRDPFAGPEKRYL